MSTLPQTCRGLSWLGSMVSLEATYFESLELWRPDLTVEGPVGWPGQASRRVSLMWVLFIVIELLGDVVSNLGSESSALCLMFCGSVGIGEVLKAQPGGWVSRA